MENNSKAASEVLVGSLLGGTNLNYIAHKGCVRKPSAYERKHWEISEKAVLSIRKELVDGVLMNCLRRTTDNGAWITAIPYRLNGM